MKAEERESYIALLDQAHQIAKAHSNAPMTVLMTCLITTLRHGLHPTYVLSDEVAKIVTTKLTPLFVAIREQFPVAPVETTAGTYPTCSPVMLECIRKQVANPDCYDVTALETLRLYYLKREQYEVIPILDEEIKRRQG